MQSMHKVGPVGTNGIPPYKYSIRIQLGSFGPLNSIRLMHEFGLNRSDSCILKDHDYFLKDLTKIHPPLTQ